MVVAMRIVTIYCEEAAQFAEVMLVLALWMGSGTRPN